MEGQILKSEARDVLMQLLESISTLTMDEYTERINVLSQSTIGEHTRHIIELFQQLFLGYDSGELNYDERKRDLRLQENIDFSTEAIATIISTLDKADKKLFISSIYGSVESKVESNYYRELLYNIEHCIHHQALIKIGLVQLGKFNSGEKYGVAKSTLEYRKQCAQ